MNCPCLAIQYSIHKLHPPNPVAQVKPGLYPVMRASQKADLTSRSLRKVGWARLSCPAKGDGSSSGVDPTRQAGPSGKGPSGVVGAIHELPLPVERFRGRGKT